MEDRNNHDGIRFNPVDQGVWKSLQQDTPTVDFNLVVGKRILANRCDRAVYSVSKFSTKTRDMLVVPFSCGQDF